MKKKKFESRLSLITEGEEGEEEKEEEEEEGIISHFKESKSTHVDVRSYFSSKNNNHNSYSFNSPLSIDQIAFGALLLRYTKNKRYNDANMIHLILIYDLIKNGRSNELAFLLENYTNNLIRDILSTIFKTNIEGSDTRYVSSDNVGEYCSYLTLLDLACYYGNASVVEELLSHIDPRKKALYILGYTKENVPKPAFTFVNNSKKTSFGYTCLGNDNKHMLNNFVEQITSSRDSKGNPTKRFGRAKKRDFYLDYQNHMNDENNEEDEGFFSKVLGILFHTSKFFLKNLARTLGNIGDAALSDIYRKWERQRNMKKLDRYRYWRPRQDIITLLLESCVYVEGKKKEEAKVKEDDDGDDGDDGDGDGDGDEKEEGDTLIGVDVGPDGDDDDGHDDDDSIIVDADGSIVKNKKGLELLRMWNILIDEIREIVKTKNKDFIIEIKRTLNNNPSANHFSKYLYKEDKTLYDDIQKYEYIIGKTIGKTKRFLGDVRRSFFGRGGKRTKKKRHTRKLSLPN